MVQRFCLISWRLMEDCYIWIMDQCDTKIGLIKQMWVSDLYFTVQWFCLITWLYDGEGHTLDNGSVWQSPKDWPHKIYVDHWRIFHGPVILLNIFKTVWWRSIIFGKEWISTTQTLAILNRCGSVTYLSWSSDFDISWTLFDGWSSYLT